MEAGRRIRRCHPRLSVQAWCACELSGERIADQGRAAQVQGYSERNGRFRDQYFGIVLFAVIPSFACEGGDVLKRAAGPPAPGGGRRAVLSLERPVERRLGLIANIIRDADDRNIRLSQLSR